MYKSISQSSQSLSGFAVDVLTDEELVKLVNDMKAEVRILRLENEVLEKSIIRLDPALMNGVYQALDYAMKGPSDSSQNLMSSFVKTQASKFGLIESLLCPSRMFSSPSRISTRRIDSSGRICGSVVSGTGPRINLNEKLELTSIVTENLANDLNKCRSNATKKKALLKAQLEEAGIRIDDIEKASELFDQEVLIEGWDKIAQRIPAEIWIRFMREWSKKVDRQIGRLRLRTSTLNIQYRKVKEEVEIKAELAERLTPVDFDKIKIENSECLKMLDRKLLQLDELKTMTGAANLNLAVHKKTMLFLNTYLAKVRKLKTRREIQTETLDNESDNIQIQVDILTEKINKIKKIRMRYKVPNVVDYVNLKEQTSEIAYAIKRLETKLHIKQTALISTNKQLKMLKSKSLMFYTSNDNLQMP